MALVSDPRCPVGKYDTLSNLCVQESPVDFEFDVVDVPKVPVAALSQPVTKGFALSSLAVLGAGAFLLWYFAKRLS